MAVTVGTISGRGLATFHAVVIFATFFGALAIGWTLHFLKIVKNEHFGYPDEWFPSISATIGDWYPERNYFQVGMALASGPRFALVIAGYWIMRAGLAERKRSNALNVTALIVGIFRTFMAGGWAFVTSYDDHLIHDVTMIAYIVSSVAYHFLYPAVYARARSPLNAADQRVVRAKRTMATLFLVAMAPLIYLFVRHKLYVIPGAYSIYALMEWSLVFLDVGWDTTSILDFSNISFVVLDHQPAPVSSGASATKKDR